MFFLHFWRRSYKASLRIKVLLPVLLCIVVILLIGNWYMMATFPDKKEGLNIMVEEAFINEGKVIIALYNESLQSKSDSMGAFLTRIAVEPLMNNDLARIFELREIVLADEDIVNLYFTNPDGEIIIGERDEKYSDFLRNSYDIALDDEKFGTVTFVLSKARLDKAIAGSEKKIIKSMSAIRDRQSIIIKEFSVEIIAILLVILVVYVTFTIILIELLILRPLRQTRKLIDSLADGKGNLTQTLPLYSHDEIGEMRAAVNRFTELLRLMMLKVQGGSDELSATTVQLAALSQNLVSSFSVVRQQGVTVHKLAESVSERIRDMASTAEQISVNTSSVSSSSEEMSLNVNGVAEILNQLNHSVEHISQSAQQGTEVVEDAIVSSGRARKSMHSLDAAAGEIDNVTAMIKRIAEQTNLLALNATIEAASAGEHGRGFAVVANEIKELAAQSSRFAENIAERIAGMQETTNESVTAIHSVTDIIQTLAEAVEKINNETHTTGTLSTEITTNMDEASAGIGTISESIAEISKGNNELSANTSSSADSTRQVVGSVQQVIDIVGETNAIAADVALASKNMEEVVGALNTLVGQFKLH